MPHFHTFDNDRETGPEVVNPDNGNEHWHIIDGEATSTTAFGADHTHEFEGEVSSGPIEIEGKEKPFHTDDDEDKGQPMKRELKFSRCPGIEVKQEERNGIQVGIVAGYIATWDIDRGAWGVKDQFIKGAFLESINELRQKNRPIRLKDHHGRTIGGFPIDGVFEDERGLFGTGEINLEVQQGKEAFSLAKQGVLSDFSIGFTSQEDVVRRMEGFDLREISKAIVWEGSIVDEPMNPEAQITEVKTCNVEEVEAWSEKDLEKALHNGTKFSQKAAKFLVSKMKGEKENTPNYNEGDLTDLLTDLKSMVDEVSADG